MGNEITLIIKGPIIGTSAISVRRPVKAFVRNPKAATATPIIFLSIPSFIPMKIIRPIIAQRSIILGRGRRKVL
jgi:hypothetical protein